MTTETFIMLEKMIFNYKRPIKEICFIINPVTKESKRIPDNFNGVDVISDATCPLENIYLRSKYI